jgi:hypothetical protein
MAKKETAPPAGVMDGNPSDMMVVTVKGYHGKILRVGQRVSRGQLIGLGGFVPTYCVPIKSPEAQAALDESEADEDGFKSNTERVRFLAAKGVHVTAKSGKLKLQAMIRDVMSATNASGAPAAPGAGGSNPLA